MQYLKKDITTVTSGLIVHSVNCQGVMGSGVAAALRRKWPQIFTEYSAICSDNKSNSSAILGTVDFVKISETPFLCVANLFGQQYYGNDGATYANPVALLQGLTRAFVFASYINIPIHSVKIGSVRGGLDWEKDVAPIFDQLESRYPLVPIYIYDI